MDAAQQKLIHLIDRSANFVKIILKKKTWHYLVKLTYVPYDPAVLFLGITPRKILLHVNQELSLAMPFASWFIVQKYWNNLILY